jgi:hypothetical protein
MTDTTHSTADAAVEAQRRADRRTRRQWGAVLVALLALGILANSIGIGKWPSAPGRYWVWIVTMVCSAAAIMVIGKAVSGYAGGLIIDNRNMMSLSKLQILVWMIVILPALITGAASNIAGIGAEFAEGGPLDIVIPNELLAILGLSGATFAAAPVILSTKTGSEASSQTLADTSAQLNLADRTEANGKVFVKTEIADASWLDLFRGDEVGNANSPDLGKIQQFFITLLLAGIYIAAIGNAYGEIGTINALPPLSEKFVWLLAASQGTYLAYKAAPHTKDK